MTARHPFLDRDSLLVTAEYVTMDSGTGCVHTAPGFGADDYVTCKRYGMDMVVPVNDQGKHTEYAGKYAGMGTDESNPVILKDMKESGMLFASEEIIHSYPHCWRCKHPIIFRATPQWFCSVDSFKDEATGACEDVRWVPAWGKDRMRSMILERTDWCISRQRRWGLPIPVFYCDDCSKPVCTDESIESVAKIYETEGSNAWFEREAAELLPEGFTCPHCGGKHFTKETDTLDGWFDSGSTHYAAMERDQGFWPATMYIEGLDQYRGWFQSSLLVAVGALGRGAPFKECVTHGWTVDGEGRAMHKSLGNGMDPAEIFNKYGADLLRLWAGSSDYHVDVRCSDEIFKQLSQNYLKFRNTARYCLGNLDGFDADDLVEQLSQLAADEIKEKGREEEVGDVKATSAAIALGALNYYLLQVNPEHDMIFNPKESISFTGNTGPYLQYMGARISSILRKYDEVKKDYQGVAFDANLLSGATEREIISALADYPGVVAKAGSQFDPSLICSYLYDLSKLFSSWYHDNPVLKAEDKTLVVARVGLCSLVLAVFRDAFTLGGLPFLERM